MLKVALIGYGFRGKDLLLNMLNHQDVQVIAVCDVCLDKAQNAQKIVQEKTNNKCACFTEYNQVFALKDLQAVVISSAWETHTDIAIAAMKAGVATGLEVGGAYTYEDCVRLVQVYEETKTPFMFLENCCYGKPELTLTKMVRGGFFGEIVHMSGAYGHDLREEIAFGNEKRHYRLRNYMLRNCENYPTHELGPIAKMLNINRGNRMVSLVSVASKAIGLKKYVQENKKDDANLLNADFKQGDIVITLITCANGETIMLKLDTTLPRTYSRELNIRGEKGLYIDQLKAIYREEVCKDSADYSEFAWNFKNYEKEYEPQIWKNMTEAEIKAGHDGLDVLTLKAFFTAVEKNEEMPIDVYDAASWMAISYLSEESIRLGGTAVTIPDFTRGKWLIREPKDVIEL